MKDYEDVTERYMAYPRVPIAQLAKSSDLVIGDLIRTVDGRILVPQVGPEEANLFAIYSKVQGQEVVVAEFATLSEAEGFLDRGEEQGFEPLRWNDFLKLKDSPLKEALKEGMHPYVRADLLVDEN